MFLPKTNKSIQFRDEMAAAHSFELQPEATGKRSPRRGPGGARAMRSASPIPTPPRRNKNGDPMSIEYLLVTFKDQRSVLVDGDGVGVTNHTLMLPSDEYTVTLDGTGYSPMSQDVVLAGTSLVRPKVIAFD
jgi:hypothetical protein